MTGWSAAWTQQAVSTSVLTAGGLCPTRCGGYLILCGAVSVVPPGSVLICQTCQRAWCGHCSRETVFDPSVNREQRIYICAGCNQGLEVFLGFFPDGEWVHLTPEEVYALEPPYGDKIWQLAYAKCRSR